jgi:hypothetical protein
MDITQMDGFSASSSWMTQRRPRDPEMKRAPDRRSQQAARDRTQRTIRNLTEQVRVLTRSLEERTRENIILSSRLAVLGTENEHLQIQIVTSQIGAKSGTDDEEATLTRSSASIMSFRHPWETPILTTVQIASSINYY